MLMLNDAALDVFSADSSEAGDTGPISLTQPAFELAQTLAKLGARDEPVGLPAAIDRTPLVELRRKGIIRTVGGARGRPAQVSLLIDPVKLIQSKRKRSGIIAPSEATRGTSTRVRPTVEDIRALLGAIDEIETELQRTLRAEIEDDIIKLKTDLVAARNGSFREREIFEELKTAMERSQTIADEIRGEALKRIETNRGPLAQFVTLLSRERSSI